METNQLAETLKRLLSQGCKHEQILNAVVLRVMNSLGDSNPSNAALIAELEQIAKRNSEHDRLNRLGQELWDDTKNADLQFLRRHPKVSFIYEHSAYWWKSRQILFTREEERTFRFNVRTEFDREEPDLLNDPKLVYLDKLTYDPKWQRFSVQPVPAIDSWWKQNVDNLLFKDNIFPPGANCSAIHFPVEKVEELQTLAADNKEWYIPGFPDVTRFRAKERRRRSM